MTTFGRSDDLRGAEFNEVDLSGARFVESDLSRVVMRGVDIQAGDIDAPWLGTEDASLTINGVDVVPFIDAELNRRFPGRENRRAADPDGLRAAWAQVEQAWAAARERVNAMPAGTVDISVDGEWSFAQTERHLIHATDTWFGRSIMELDDPFHPLGLKYLGTDDPGAEAPPYADVLEGRAGRVAMVREFIAATTPTELDAPRKNPHSPENPETVRHCLHVIIEEEWEHLRFATRDLDTLESR
ncbi:DinB family protein [Kribbella sp. NPDC049584]|uniref:DinB family protein n=1 Tax=Kribbella sp. NPDC049584 TaxID=3154833 RepID=UPI0034429E2F